MKTKLINEIVDSDDDLIGANKVPQNGSDLATRAANTTDYNNSVAHQQYRSDFLGRMGFSSLFYESEDKTNTDDENNQLLKDLTKKAFDIKFDFLKYYYKNPQKLKADYRLLVDVDYKHDHSNVEATAIAKEIMKTIHPHISKAIDEIAIQTLSEDIVHKSEKDDEFSTKKEDKLIDKNIEKIADLINKQLDNKEGI